MKKFKPLQYIKNVPFRFLAPLLALLLLSCGGDDDGLGNTNAALQVSQLETTAEDLDTNDFLWKAMNVWYFWQGDVNDLRDDRFDSDEAYTQFLEATPHPEDFIQKLMFPEDRFTFWESDYKVLVDALSGISKSNGLEFGLVQFSNSTDIFGYVRYIVPDSNASTQDIERGDLFTRVDGQTLNLDNYINLLYGDNDTYTLGLATIEGDTVVDTDEQVTLTKEEGLLENPVFIANTLEVNGIKVAYLMYNGFTNEFDTQLNNAFAQFLSDGATELVLDLRYNPGGSVNSSRLLSSMVYGPNTNDLYLRQRWNDKLMSVLSPAELEDYFANTVNGSPLNSMRLSKVYVLTTNRTASASELVINGLDPYVNVVQIGDVTTGKNEFSLTLVDDPDQTWPYLYDENRESQINPDNRWALQPLTGRNENAAGFFEYTDGLSPDIALDEDMANLGVLGDPNEPLLARALQEITGTTAKTGIDLQMPAKAFTDSKMFKPLKDHMVLDKKLDIVLEH